MAELQATWTAENRMFFWSSGDALQHVVQRELPALASLNGHMSRRPMTLPEPDPKRSRASGFEVDLTDTVPLLASLPRDADVSDTVQCWSYATKLALELAASERVVPSVMRGQAHWRALLTRDRDLERFEQIVQAMPPAARAIPTKERGALRLYSAAYVARAFLDLVVDTVYRTGAYPGPARGWPLEFAESLSGERRQFTPRDARAQGIPGQISVWSQEAERSGLRLGLYLDLPPDADAETGSFQLRGVLFPGEDPTARVPVTEAFHAGEAIEIQGKSYRHPAMSAIRGLARAARLHEPLLDMLQGKQPKDLVWSSQQAWAFLDEGAERLRAAGIEVILPDAFDEAGQRRIRTRLRFVAPPNGVFDLSDDLDFRWEVVLGDLVLEGEEFAELISAKKPIVRFRGQWVLLDPTELARLPDDVAAGGKMPAAAALRAILTGQHEGTPVVVDERLNALIELLRSPPDVPLPAGLNGTLRPYQERGFSWLSTLGGLGLGACLADDMGLGKTIQLITHLLHRKATQTHRRPSLVICPTSVLGNWRRELEKFAPSLKVLRYHGLDRDTDKVDGYDVVITTYGLLVRDREALCAREWDVVALDEAQSIKNPESQRARAAREIKARHRVALSGTPVENRLDELWSLMAYLVPGLLNTRTNFRRNVAVPVERFGDEDVAQRLKLGVAPFLLRRLKSDPDIVGDLPDKIERNDYTGLTSEQAKLYDQVVQKSLDEIADAHDIERRGRVLAMLTALKQVCNHPAHYLKTTGSLEGRSGKLERVDELLDNIAEIGEYTLIFTQYREMGELLKSHLEDRYGCHIPFLHGGTPAHHRDEIVRVFQEEDDAPPVLVISLKAGGTGLNLTRATHVIHFDRWWNPAVEDQATDRAYRIGQHQNVQVYKLVCQGTLEERIHAMLDEKRALANSVVGSGEAWVTDLDDDALRALVALGDDAVMEA